MRGYEAWLHSPGPTHYREVRCGECGYRWEVLGHTEYGTWWPERDEHLVCEECGGEVE